MTALVTALTEDFTLGEFIVSREYPHLASQVRDCLTETDKIKCFLLARLYLQNVRNQYKSAITILSGKRSFELNKAIGGSSTSDHLFLNETAAVDFTCENIKDVAVWISMKDWGWGQLIYYPHQKFIHISLPSQKHYREKLKSIDGKITPLL